MAGTAGTAFAKSVLEGRPETDTAAAEEVVRPKGTAVVCTLVFLGIGIVLAALVGSKGNGFAPRVGAIDTLAGLVIGAFIVDRLLTFAYPIGAAGGGSASDAEDVRKLRIKQRSTDIAFLRVGFGAALGGLFVLLTNLQAIKVLAPGQDVPVGESVDRLIAMLAIAGGVAGLSALLGGLNPQPATDPATGEAEAAADAAGGGADDQGDDEEGDDENDEDEEVADEPIPPPTASAYVIGIVAVVVAVLIAWIFAGDAKGLDLIGKPTPQEGGTDDTSIELVVRFGVILLAAGIIEQLVERVVAPLVKAKENKSLVTGAVALVLGVIAARVFDLFLLHNIGFFDVGKDLNMGLDDSSGVERRFDIFLTGAVIAAGTKPIHDLGSGLKKRAAAIPKTKTTPAQG
jgi:hypothetical protein